MTILNCQGVLALLRVCQGSLRIGKTSGPVGMGGRAASGVASRATMVTDCGQLRVGRLSTTHQDQDDTPTNITRRDRTTSPEGRGDPPQVWPPTRSRVTLFRKRHQPGAIQRNPSPARRTRPVQNRDLHGDQERPGRATWRSTTPSARCHHTGTTPNACTPHSTTSTRGVRGGLLPFRDHPERSLEHTRSAATNVGAAQRLRRRAGSLRLVRIRGRHESRLDHDARFPVQSGSASQLQGQRAGSPMTTSPGDG